MYRRIFLTLPLAAAATPKSIAVIAHRGEHLHHPENTLSAIRAAIDAASILKPMLARGELQTIGATTLDEYRKYIEKDAALERRFQPIFVDGALRPPAQERFVVSSETIDDLRRVREGGGRVVAVGITTTRALETVGSGVEGQGTTALFIHPGFQFAFVDALVTNFHQPGTTHLLLVEALLGRTLLEKCYSAALSEGYRFLSYGDGMLIV